MPLPLEPSPHKFVGFALGLGVGVAVGCCCSSSDNCSWSISDNESVVGFDVGDALGSIAVGDGLFTAATMTSS